MRTMLLAAILALTLTVSVQGQVTFYDNFESYGNGVVAPGPNWTGYNMAASAQAYHQVETDSLGVAHSGSKVYHTYRDETSLGVGGSCAMTTLVNIRQSEDPGVYIFTAWAYLGSTGTSNQAIMMSSKLAFWTRNADNAYRTWVGFKLDGHFNYPRQITYFNGSNYNVEDANVPLDTWMKVESTIDEVSGKWDFAITTEDGGAVFSRSNLSLRSSGLIEKLSVYFETNGSNDGWNNRIDDISFEHYVAPSTCADMRSRGLLLEGDLNEDCRVDLLDFADFSSNWLKCNDPLDSACW